MDKTKGGTLEQGRTRLSFRKQKECVHLSVNLFTRDEGGASPAVLVERFTSKLINVTS